MLNYIASHGFSDEKDFIKLTKAVSELTKFYEIPEEEEKERLLKAKSFIDAAEDDLDSAKILYASGIYSTAIYHLQQTVEKLVKAYMIQFSILNKKDIKDYVGHDSPKAFFRLIERFKNCIDFVLLFLDTDHRPDSQIQSVSRIEVHNLEGDLKNSKAKIAKYDSDDIRNKLKIANASLELFVDHEKIKADISESLINLKKELYEIKTSEINRRRDEAIDLIDKLHKKVMNDSFFISLKFHSNLTGLYILALLTYPHATFARYPNKFLSPESYDADLGIVQCFGEITKVIDKIINSWNENLLT